MSKRVYNKDPKQLLEEGRQIVSSTEYSKYIFRVVLVNFVLGGNTVTYVAEMSGVAVTTLNGWVKSVNESGFESLKAKPIPGRPNRLTAAQIDEIDKALQDDPNKYGHKIWDGPNLSDYIKKTYDIDIGIRQCQRLFHSLGYSHIRPQTYPSKGSEDSSERVEFKKNSLK